MQDNLPAWPLSKTILQCGPQNFKRDFPLRHLSIARVSPLSILWQRKGGPSLRLTLQIWHIHQSVRTYGNWHIRKGQGNSASNRAQMLFPDLRRQIFKLGEVYKRLLLQLRKVRKLIRLLWKHTRPLPLGDLVGALPALVKNDWKRTEANPEQKIKK